MQPRGTSSSQARPSTRSPRRSRRPLEALRRIHRLHDAVFGETPRADWLAVDEELAAELRGRLTALGYDGDLGEALLAWAGKENLEERVDGTEEVDPVVLEALRETR